jgi:enoyl-CoA hydratase
MPKIENVDAPSYVEIAMTSIAKSTCKLDRQGTTIIATLLRAHCLDVAGKDALLEVFREIGQDESARAVVLRSEHPAAMLVDVSELVQIQPREARAFSQKGHHLANIITSLPMPVIVAVDGPALGGGCELVLSCDIALAGTKANLGQIEALGGVIPGFGGTWRLSRRVGFQRACEMIFTGAVVDSQTAAAYGLVLASVPSSDLLTRCMELADRIAKVSRTSVAEAKRVMNEGWALPPAVASAIEQSAFAALFGTVDQRQRMKAALEEEGS